MGSGISARAYPVKALPVFDTDTVIDCHSHIQSGACAPLPMIWHQMGVVEGTHLSRGFMDVAANVRFWNGGPIQKKKTEEIGSILTAEIQKAYNSGSKLFKDKPYSKAKSLFTPSFIMPMDMDYAHISGFPPGSYQIYHDEVISRDNKLGLLPLPGKSTFKGVCYYIRKNAQAPEHDGEFVNVSDERPNRVWVYQHYIKQYKATKEAIKANPWQLIPMFHYDPRRWVNQSKGPMDADSWKFGPWDDPFRHIATKLNAGVFIGFKMYPPLGYKPLDARLPYLNDFYSRCVAHEIPILVHCSPGGMITHDANLYYAFDKKEFELETSVAIPRKLSYNPRSAEGYFFDEYVHPKNWRPVLEKNNNLKLCLAHFGGREWEEIGVESDWIQEIVSLTKKYKNVYTDISCYNLKNDKMKAHVLDLFFLMANDEKYYHLQDKVLFGVDWYLTLLGDAPEYKGYVESFFDLMKIIDKWQWYRSAIVNPARFYGLDDQEKLKQMFTALVDNKADKLKRDNGFESMKKLKQQAALIAKELDKLKTNPNTY